MKRFIALFLALGMASVFAVGCDKNKETTIEKPTTYDAGTTTETETHKVETDKQ
jgi:hypothetical protein